MTRSRRAVLTLYGVASVLVFVWVPWRGYETPIYQVPKDRWNSTFLGYGLVWSQLKPPAAFVKYAIEDAKYSVEYAEYQRYHGASPPPGYTVVPPPAQTPAGAPPRADPFNLQSGVVTSASPPPPKKPEVPEGYISPGIYRWARLDYERVFLEFGALTGLLLVAWMFTYTEGKSK